MRGRTWLIAGVLAALSAALVVVLVLVDKGASSPPTPAEQKGKVLYWYDPMVPNQHFDKPGKSPFMDMQLVPKYADLSASGTSEGANKRVDVQTTQLLGVRTEMVKQGDFTSTIRAFGEIRWDERLMADVEVRAKGRIVSLEANAVGERVHAGETLARLDSPDVVAAQEELHLAEQMKDPSLIAAAEKRLSWLDAARGVDTVAIKAQTEGVITEINARRGALVEPGNVLMRIVGTDPVWLIVDVPTSETDALAVGRAVSIRLDDGEILAGSIDFVYPQVEANVRTTTARVVLANSRGLLRAGMRATVFVDRETLHNVITVPTDAIIRTGTRAVVMRAEGEGHFTPIDVTIGQEGGDLIVVRTGLREGDRVAVSAQFLLDAEASLRGAYARMTPLQKVAQNAAPEPPQNPSQSSGGDRTHD